MKTSQDKLPGVISITDHTVLADGSVKVSYALDECAVQRCAHQLNKSPEDLTEEEIHSFVIKNIGSALKGQEDWKSKKIVE